MRHLWHNGIFWGVVLQEKEGKVCRRLLTRVVEEAVDEGAVPEGGSHRGHVLEVTVDERRVDERDRLELHTDEPERAGEVNTHRGP